MRSALLAGALVQAVGCGRIGFDATTSPTDATNATDATDSSPPLTGPWAHVFAGGTTVCGVKPGGEAWCWGANADGQSGSPGPRSVSITPVQLPGSWSKLAPSRLHTCGIQTNGTLWCWGYGEDGELGDGMVATEVAPQQVGASNDWQDVGTGIAHSCGLRPGAAWCWGANVNNEIAPSGTNIGSPVMADTNVAAIAVAGSHTCTLHVDGTLWCMGANAGGELGFGDVNTHTPIAMVGSDTTWASLATSEAHTCGLRTDGSLWCWGAGTRGQLGTGDGANHLVPVQVGAGVDWSEVRVAAEHSCGRKLDGRLWCWGPSDHGTQDPIDVDALAPVDQAITASSLALADALTCYVDALGVMRCRGSNGFGQLDQPAASSIVPVRADAMTWSTLSIESATMCGLDSVGKLWCWGENASGQVGDGSVRGRQLPISLGTETWTAVATGAQTTAAINGGQLYEWGRNIATDVVHTTPNLLDSNTNWTAVVSGDAHSCALRTSSQAFCWGDATKLGIAAGSATSAPTTAVTNGWTRIAAGHAHTCADQVGGGVFCWGSNSYGQLADNTLTDRVTPVGSTCQGGCTAGTIASLTAGSGQTCIVQQGGQLSCSGDNSYGQFGTGSVTNVPQFVAGPTGFATVAAADSHVCGTKLDGTLWCWGDGAAGELGANMFSIATTTPVQVGTATTWTMVVTGDRTTCALQTDGSRWCWGRDDRGQYGDGKSWVTAFVVVANNL